MKQPVTRRTFLGTVVAGGAFAARTPARVRASEQSGPALLGGTPLRRTPFPSWPIADAREEEALVGVIRSGKWFRGQQVAAFEAAYASLTGATHCLATANGTSALITSLGALGIGPGDEVIVPPYTFVATINAVLLMHALPVFVDTDIETFQIDAKKIESALTDRTRAIIPYISAARQLTSARSCRSRKSAVSPSSRMPARRTSQSGGAKKSERTAPRDASAFKPARTSTQGKAGPSSRATTP